MDYNNIEQQEMEGRGFRIKFLLGAVSVLVIALIMLVAILIMGSGKKQKYATAIKNGNAYYNAGDYQSAIAQYQLAINIDKKKSSGYMNMASAYVSMGDYNSAINVVQCGISLANSQVLENRLNELKNLSTVQAYANTYSLEELVALSEGVTAENAMFDMIASYTYTEYYRDYGAQATLNVLNGQVTIHYEDVDLYTTYYDTAGEKVLDNSGRMPIAGVKPCYITLGNLRSLFASNSDRFVVSYARLCELFGNDVEVMQDSSNGKYYVRFTFKNCIVKIETDPNGNIVNENAWNQIEPSNRTSFDEEHVDGQVSGYIQNAVTGRGISATIKIRNRGSKTGNVIDEIRSLADGNYVYGGSQGTYTAEVSATGFLTEYIDIEIVRGQVKTGKNVVLSPILNDGEIRIVLTWGSYPTDLDSHAEGNSSSGGGFHIWFQNKNVNNVGTLDVDDTNGFGPETITIKDGGANFTYSVIDYTRSGNMSSSGATVKVYLPGESQARVYTIPSGTGNTWRVFSIQNGEISVINTIN